MMINESSCSMHQPIDTVHILEEVCEQDIFISRNIPEYLIPLFVTGIQNSLRFYYEYFEGDLEEVLYGFRSIRDYTHNADAFLDELEEQEERELGLIE